MLRRTTRTITLAAGIALLAAACGEAPQPVGPGAESLGLHGLNGLSDRSAAPNRAEITRQVPGFGGVYLDEDGRPTVFLTDLAQRGAIQQQLGGFAREHGFAPTDIQVRQGDYDFLELDDWLGRVWRDALAVEGAVFAGVSETHNRVLIGVEDLGLAPQIRGLAEGRGVPAEALAFELAEPVVALQTLQSVVNPIVGGVQINFPGFLCTFGFNALHAAGESWITNSHCTDNQGTMTGTLYRQPLTSVDPTVMGVEVDDPPYVGGGALCPPGRVCRLSDAARVRREGEPTRTFARGALARLGTTFSASSPIAGHFHVTEKHAQAAPGQNCPVVGTTIHKVGRTTGWTHGSVASPSCQHTNVAFSNITLLHQVRVTTASNGVSGGDSGSPVFFRQGADPNFNVTLHGILWGGSGTTAFVFSPITNVEVELGPLEVTADGDPPPPPPPPNEPPTVTWVNPLNGQTVGGEIAIEIEAVDDNDSGADLTVEWRVVVPGSGGRGGGGSTGPWQPASHAGGDLFTATWTAEDGNYTLDARATDSEGATSAIASIAVTVDNDEDPPPPPPPPPGEPTVSWLNPTNGQTVSGTVAIELEATDENDSGADLTVEWRVTAPGGPRGGGGPGPWQPASHAGGDLFTASWTPTATGSHTLDARATNSQGATSAIASISVTVQNGGDPPPPPPR